jgi:hypothetical protein
MAEVQAGHNGIENRDGRVYLHLDGQTWELPPLNPIKDFPEAEKRCQGSLGSYARSLQGLVFEFQRAAPGQRRGVGDRVYALARQRGRGRPLSDAEFQQWLDSTEGVAWSLWRMLGRRYPDVTEDLARTLVDRLGLEACQRARDDASRAAIQALGHKLDNASEAVRTAR